jgi:hypothetical protein
MKTAQEIFDEYFTEKWVSQTGLGRLDPFPEDSTPWGTSETVTNENGILFLACFLMLSKQCDVDIFSRMPRFIGTVRSLEVAPGLYNRQPYFGEVSPRYEAHDNYVAIAGLSAVWKLVFAREILEYGAKHRYNYNNREPGVWKIEQQRQPGEVAFYKLCAGLTPSLSCG